MSVVCSTMVMCVVAVAFLLIKPSSSPLGGSLVGTVSSGALFRPTVALLPTAGRPDEGCL